MFDFLQVFLWFVIYSFMGWAYETILCSFTEKHFVNRGFLRGPFCPIYGFGALAVFFTFSSLKDNIALLFLLSALLTSLLEYTTSLLLEKLFHAKWWDYSHYRFHLHGRISLIGAAAFGTMSVLQLWVLHPAISKLTVKLPNTYLLFVSLVLFIIIVCDGIFTARNIIQFNQKLSEIQEILNKYKIQTLEMTQHIKETFSEHVENNIRQVLQFFDKRFQMDRMLRAFPKMQSIKYSDAFRWFEEYISSNKLFGTYLYRKKERKQRKV